MTIEIVDLPIRNGGSFHSYVDVYQRVTISMFKFRLVKYYNLPRLLISNYSP